MGLILWPEEPRILPGWPYTCPSPKVDSWTRAIKGNTLNIRLLKTNNAEMATCLPESLLFIKGSVST